MKKAAIFGDSIMRGMFWNEKLAKHKLWQNPYPARIAAESGIEIENHSFIGSTIKRGRAIFDKMRNIERNRHYVQNYFKMDLTHSYLFIKFLYGCTKNINTRIS